MFVTSGREGSAAYYPGGILRQETFLDVPTVDTTGAGDIFFGCMLDTILRLGPEGFSPQEMQEALRFASAAAAIVTTRPGATRSVPRREEVDAFLNGHPLVGPEAALRERNMRVRCVAHSRESPVSQGKPPARTISPGVSTWLHLLFWGEGGKKTTCHKGGYLLSVFRLWWDLHVKKGGDSYSGTNDPQSQWDRGGCRRDCRIFPAGGGNFGEDHMDLRGPADVFKQVGVRWGEGFSVHQKLLDPVTFFRLNQKLSAASLSQPADAGGLDGAAASGGGEDFKLLELAVILIGEGQGKGGQIGKITADHPAGYCGRPLSDGAVFPQVEDGGRGAVLYLEIEEGDGIRAQGDWLFFILNRGFAECGHLPAGRGRVLGKLIVQLPLGQKRLHQELIDVPHVAGH